MRRGARSIAVCLTLAACGGEGKQTSATGSTSGAGTGSSTGSTTGGASTGSGGDTTSTSGVGSTTSSGGEYPCADDPCGRGEICLGHDGGSGSCVPNPEGCGEDVPCSPACEALCGAWLLGWCVGNLPGSLLCDTCDVWAQDCPEGEKCMPWASDGGSSWNALRCTPIEPSPGKPGDPCTAEGISGVDSCEEGAMCLVVDWETMAGHCIGFCDGSPVNATCAEPGTQCFITGGNAVLILCLPECDPLLQDCPKGELCNGDGDGFSCQIDASGEEGHYGDPCELAGECDPGLECVGAEKVPGCQAGGCCSPYCELDAEHTTIPAPTPKCPDPAMACLAWFEVGEAPAGLEKVGVCGVAP